MFLAKYHAHMSGLCKLECVDHIFVDFLSARHGLSLPGRSVVRYFFVECVS